MCIRCATGSIPAYAGEASRPSPSKSIARVDPRVRGGGLIFTNQLTICKGRSPRTRGRRLPAYRLQRLRGSIPAYAGEAADRRCDDDDDQVDPRVRGGGRPRGGASSSRKGRSPRTRGRPPHQPHRTADLGSIPAYAGEAGHGLRTFAHRRVDPRVRGGGPMKSYTHQKIEGRSPRTRGRRHAFSSLCFHSRSIPAYAGEAGDHEPPRLNLKVDPRVRGGGKTSYSIVPTMAGRSPRTRGRQDDGIDRGLAGGSIPAYAGEASNPAS